MSIKLFKALLSLVIVSLSVSNANGQLLKNIKKKLENKAEELVDKGLNQDFSLSEKEKEEEALSTKGKNQSGPFKVSNLLYEEIEAGSEVIFYDDFKADQPGNMASKWVSNGTGSVESVDGFPGKWLKVFPKNTYKIKELYRIPEDYMVSFDLLTRVETKQDFDVEFGFDYQKGVSSHYFLGGRNPINVKASFRFNRFEFTSNEVSPKQQSEIEANMSYFANDVMKVIIRVEGKRMRTYINGYKVQDVETIDTNTRKYFYLAIQNDQKDTDIFISNVKISKF